MTKEKRKPNGFVDYLCASVAGFLLAGIFGASSVGFKDYGTTTTRPGPSKGIEFPYSTSVFKKGYAGWTQISGRRNESWNESLDIESKCDMAEAGLLFGMGGLSLACAGTAIKRSREEEDSPELL